MLLKQSISHLFGVVALVNGSWAIDCVSLWPVSSQTVHAASVRVSACKFKVANTVAFSAITTVKQCVLHLYGVK